MRGANDETEKTPISRTCFIGMDNPPKTMPNKNVIVGKYAF